MNQYWLVLFTTFATILLATYTARAQEVAAQHMITVAAGVMDFDLSGTGTTWVGAVRGTRALTDHLALEAGTSFGRPDQQFGDSTMIGPEAQLQYHWRLGRFRPYAGGGVGFAYVKSDFISSDTDLTLSAAGGLRFDLNSRTAVLGEMRLRGFERDFAGSTAEWVGGLSWRLGD